MVYKYFRMACWNSKIKSTKIFVNEYTILFVVSPSLLLLNFQFTCRYPKIFVHDNYNSKVVDVKISRFPVSREGPVKGTKTRQTRKHSRRLPCYGMMVEKSDKTTLCYIYSRYRVVFLLFFYLCLVSALFAGPSILEIKFSKNSFHY